MDKIDDWPRKQGTNGHLESSGLTPVVHGISLTNSEIFHTPRTSTPIKEDSETEWQIVGRKNNKKRSASASNSLEQLGKKADINSSNDKTKVKYSIYIYI